MADDSIIRAFLSLAALFAVLGILYFVVKRLSVKGKLPGMPQNLKIISKLSLQPKTNLYVVKAGEKTLLIGVSGNSITTLADLTDGDNTSKLDSAFKSTTIRDEAQPLLSFREFIKTSLKKIN